jgi:hypothetical protein
VLVGAPVLGLLGILEAGRSLTAPVSVGGEWKVQSDSVVNCPAVPRTLSISQSGADLLITFNGGRTIEGAVSGSTVSGKSVQAAISGPATARTLNGTIGVSGCGPVSFRAMRQPRQRGE